MFEQKDAIVRLLSDDDAWTVNLVKEELAKKGSAAIPDLRDLLEIDDERVTRNVKAVLGEIDARQARQTLGELCARFDDEDDIEPAVWLLARALQPGVDIPSYQNRIDQWALRLRPAVTQEYSPRRRVESINRLLGEEFRFRGNTDNYYRAANSLLPTVIDQRLGIPISLCLLYILVGRRAGMEIEGINFPGHFLARHEDILFDPFARGRILSMEDCQEILDRQKLVLDPSHLAVAHPRAMLMRLIANLVYVFQTEESKPEAEMTARWLHALDRVG